jgi:hypothetical protein
VLLPPDAEQLLCRICFLQAEFAALYRCGRPDPILAAAGDDGRPITVDNLLAAVPRFAVEDLAAMVATARTGLAELRSSTSPAWVTPGPYFAGSEAVGHADADFVAAGLLVDVKATVHPDRLSAFEVYQLAAYALLDWDDKHRLTAVGWYLARSGLLITWPLPDFLRLLGARGDIHQLRAEAARRLDSPHPARWATL